MKIIWSNSDQHTEWGLFRVGDRIDTTEMKIPSDVVSSWTRDRYAIEERLSEESAKPRKSKKATKED